MSLRRDVFSSDYRDEVAVSLHHRIDQVQKKASHQLIELKGLPAEELILEAFLELSDLWIDQIWSLLLEQGLFCDNVLNLVSE